MPFVPDDEPKKSSGFIPDEPEESIADRGNKIGREALSPQSQKMLDGVNRQLSGKGLGELGANMLPGFAAVKAAGPLARAGKAALMGGAVADNAEQGGQPHLPNTDTLMNYLKGGPVGLLAHGAMEGLGALGAGAKAMYRSIAPGSADANLSKLHQLLGGKTAEINPNELHGVDPEVDNILNRARTEHATNPQQAPAESSVRYMHTAGGPMKRGPDAPVEPPAVGDKAGSLGYSGRPGGYSTTPPVEAPNSGELGYSGKEGGYSTTPPVEQPNLGELRYSGHPDGYSTQPPVEQPNLGEYNGRPGGYSASAKVDPEAYGARPAAPAPQEQYQEPKGSGPLGVSAEESRSGYGMQRPAPEVQPEAPKEQVRYQAPQDNGPMTMSAEESRSGYGAQRPVPEPAPEVPKEEMRYQEPSSNAPFNTPDKDKALTDYFKFATGDKFPDKMPIQAKDLHDIRAKLDSQINYNSRFPEKVESNKTLYPLAAKARGTLHALGPEVSNEYSNLSSALKANRGIKEAAKQVGQGDWTAAGKLGSIPLTEGAKGMGREAMSQKTGSPYALQEILNAIFNRDKK